jgi:hypothetical protein
MKKEDGLTRGEVEILLNVPLTFVSGDPQIEASGESRESIVSDADVLRVAIARELLGALYPIETRFVVESLQKWVPTSPWGWLLVYDGNPLEIEHTTDQNAADRAVSREGFRARLHLDPFLREVLERLDAFRGNG